MLTRLFRTALERILRADAENAATTPGAVVLALSGGADSVVAAHLLAQNADLLKNCLPPGCRVVAAHLNHRLRPEADEEEEFCRACAARLNIPFAAKRVDIAATAKRNRAGIEETGRQERYGFFRELGGKRQTLVITGHHADDQAETILLNLRRGAHRRGLSGMRELSVLAVPDGFVRIARPLLAATKAELREYAAAHALDHRTDASNEDNAYARNKIRNKILPALERLAPGFRRRLLERAHKAAEEEAALARDGELFANARTRREHNGLFFRIDETLPIEAAEHAELLRYAFRHIVETETTARLRSGAALTRLSELAGNSRPGETISLPGNLRVRREQDGLFFFSPEKKRNTDNGNTEILLPAPPFRIETHGLEITAEFRTIPFAAPGASPAAPPPEDAADPATEWLNAAAINGTLRLRPPREGERFRSLNAPGGRKIQDILTDAKIPRRARAFPRVLADEDGALWIWPLRPAHRARLLSPSRENPGQALRVRIREF